MAREAGEVSVCVLTLEWFGLSCGREVSVCVVTLEWFGKSCGKGGKCVCRNT